MQTLSNEEVRLCKNLKTLSECVYHANLDVVVTLITQCQTDLDVLRMEKQHANNPDAIRAYQDEWRSYKRVHKERSRMLDRQELLGHEDDNKEQATAMATNDDVAMHALSIQNDSMDRLKGIARTVNETKAIGEDTLKKLAMTTEAIEHMYDDLSLTEDALQRSLQRKVMADKYVVCVTGLVALAIVVIVILSAL